MRTTLALLVVGLLFGGASARAEAGDAGAVGTAGCGKALPAGVTAGTTLSRSVTSHGSARSYLLHVPAGYAPGTAVPVVFNFHGFGSNPAKQNELSGLVPLSEREGFVLVTPDGGIGWRFAVSAREENAAFVLDVLEAVEAELCVDPQRVYATGKSQGGFMSSWLGCVAADRFAAIAPVAGMYEPSESCRPIPVLEMHGKADTTIPYAGGHVLVLGHFPGAVAVMQKWAATNRCTGAPDTVEVTAHVQRATYPGCAATTVQYLTDAGHTWPGSTVREGDNSRPADLPAAELIWAFFKAHPKP